MVLRDLDSFISLLHVISTWLLFHVSKWLLKPQSLCLYSKQQKGRGMKGLILPSKNISQKLHATVILYPITKFSHTAAPTCKEGWGMSYYSGCLTS